MVNKKDFTVEEMRQQLTEAQKRADELREKLQKAEQDEKDRKQAQLALEKEKRHEEVEKARDTYYTLLKAYTEDYGSYTALSKAEDYDWFPNAFWRSFF